VKAVRDVWSGSHVVENLKLSENDRVDLAQVLAIKLPAEVDAIVAHQLANTANPDSKRKLEFLTPSLSADPAERDRFFASLANEDMREVESWVLDALANLHHPLRADVSERYLLPSLELLQEIQVTGDIFFPKRWLDETLGNYRSATAVRTVRNFLDERPAYNNQLRMKILQSADMMFRASAIMSEDVAD
jgi:aminopeptidase N